MAEIKELVVVTVEKVIKESETAGQEPKRYALVSLKQVAGVSAVTGAIKYKMENGQPLVATRYANLNDRDVTSLNVGDIIDGEIVKVPTTDYQINGRTVNTFTQAVYDGEKAVDLVNTALAKIGHAACALLSDGKPSNPDVLNKEPKPITGANEPAQIEQEEPAGDEEQ